MQQPLEVKLIQLQNGAHIGIASNVIVNDEGQKHFIYKDKKKIFTSPAFNFDEVSELPNDAILLSSDKVNNVMGVSFKSETLKLSVYSIILIMNTLKCLNLLLDVKKDYLLIKIF